MIFFLLYLGWAHATRTGDQHTDRLKQIFLRKLEERNKLSTRCIGEVMQEIACRYQGIVGAAEPTPPSNSQPTLSFFQWEAS